MRRKNSRKTKNFSSFSSLSNGDVEKFNRFLSQSIPISIFRYNLSPLETISKYLHENLGFSFKKISDLINRDSRTISQAYRSAKKKYPKRFIARDFAVTIPIHIFSDRKLSILEHLVFWLKDLDLKFSEIARLLDRDQRTIWTVFNRAKKKHGKK